MRVLALICLAAASLAGSTRAAGAAAPGSPAAIPCQRTVDPALQVSLPYTDRGDRCEGVYADPLHSSPLHVLGFGPPPPAPDNLFRSVVAIRWQALRSDTVFIRSELVRSRAYYQMDTRVPPGSDGFPWTLDIANAAGHPISEFDLTCWTPAAVQRRSVSLLVPCRFDEVAPAAAPLQLRLMTDEPLRAISFSLGRLGADGREEASIVADRSLGGPYGTGYRLEIPVGELRAGAVYRLAVRCTLLNGAPHTEEFWLRRS